MRIFHIATVADWDAARASGAYTTSTVGRTLAEEGYIHASRGDQWQGVRERYYADVTEPLLLLVVETDLLTSPVVEEPVPSGELFPHVYGPIDPAAVVQTIPLGSPADDARVTAALAAPGPSFSALFLGEMFHRMLLAGIVMAAVVVGVLVGTAVDGDVGPLLGVLAGAVVGVPVAVLVHRRRERGLTPAAPRPPRHSPS